jgi:hypothetical protein
MKIKVTQADIDAGIRSLRLPLDNRPPRCACCPVARAVRRAFKARRGVAVYSIHIWVGGTGYDSPESVKSFLNCFDRGLTSMPFTFELTKP